MRVFSFAGAHRRDPRSVTLADVRTPFATLLVLVAAACGASTQEDELQLPVSKESELAQPTDFVLTLRHVPPAGVECGNRACNVCGHWVADTRSSKAKSPLIGRLRLDESDWWPLRKSMREDVLGEQLPTGEAVTGATLSIRAAPETPIRVVTRLLLFIHQFTDLLHVEFSVEDPGIRGPRRLPAPLSPGPSYGSGGPFGVRVRIAEHRRAENEYFAMAWYSDPFAGEAIVSGPWPPRPGQPSEDERPFLGLGALATHLREWRVVQERQPVNRGIYKGVITLSEAPFQSAIEVFDTFMAAGFDLVYWDVN